MSAQDDEELVSELTRCSAIGRGRFEVFLVRRDESVGSAFERGFCHSSAIPGSETRM